MLTDVKAHVVIAQRLERLGPIGERRVIKELPHDLGAHPFRQIVGRKSKWGGWLWRRHVRQSFFPKRC
jgi:hypothetical protein